MSGQPKNTGFPTNGAEPSPGFSYWETKGWLGEPDAVVVGAGLVGMNAALRLKEKHPHWRVVMVDQASLGGATTRNAGFACFGSPSELLDDWNTLGPEATVELVRMRWQGLQALRSMWGDEALGYRPCGAVEAFTDNAEWTRCTAALPMLNDALSEVFGQAPFREVPSGPTGLRAVAGTIASPMEGDLDTAKMATALRHSLQHQDIALVSGVRIESLTRSSSWTLKTSMGTLTSPRVLVCNNGWASELLDVEVSTTPNVVVVSEPIANLALTSTVHHDRGYVYAREIDGRVLIGGGRHWNCATENERIERLTAWAETHIVDVDAFRVAHCWVGQLGVGPHRQPVMEEVEPGLFAGVRLGGMGVAIGTLVGRKLADLV